MKRLLSILTILVSVSVTLLVLWLTTRRSRPSGIRILPGESASLDFFVSPDLDLQALLKSGAKITVGPCRTSDGNTWKRDIDIVLDDEQVARFEIAWEGEYDPLRFELG